jgi:TM2 domain-containing membrane protein YozV
MAGATWNRRALRMDVQRELLIEQRVANEAKSPLIAYLLLIFLWGFGVHRMYLGRWISGFIMLAIWGVGWLTVPILIGWPAVGFVVLWCIIDLFLIPGMVRADREDIRRRLR